MRTIGILGGMSWESTALYYRWINEGVRERLGGLHSAPLLLDSCDFAAMEKLQTAEKWHEIGEALSKKALKLEAAGAQGVLLATNTMHEAAGQIEGALTVPFLHIADALGEALVRDGITAVGLLGTRFTMERTFLTGRLKEKYAVDTLLPGSDGREEAHRIIYEELCRGTVRESSRMAYLAVMENLVREGAQAVVLGCTEIGILVGREDTQIPLYDTARLHARAAVNWILAGNQEL